MNFRVTHLLKLQVLISLLMLSIAFVGPEPIIATCDDSSGNLVGTTIANVHSWDTGIVDCGECKGGVTELTLQYNGVLENATVRVKQKEGADIVVLDVNPGDPFTVLGTGRDGKFGRNITLFVNDNVNAEIHTSCSQDIGPGLIAGDFLVINGHSKDGGEFCPIGAPPLGISLFSESLRVLPATVLVGTLMILRRRRNNTTRN